MKLLSNRAATALRYELDIAGYSSWYKQHSGNQYELDPWAAFSKVLSYTSRDSNTHASLVDLFLRGLPVSQERISEILDREIVNDLVSSGFLIETNNGVKSTHCILVAFNNYLIVEYPAVSYNELFVSSKAYLSSLSYRAVQAARVFLPATKVLDLGCGTGIISLVSSRSARTVLATDIDHSALRLARANIELNGCPVLTLEADMFHGLAGSSFDLIVFNPPWRLVPPGVAYPNMPARVGKGKDGLDSVREFLRDLPDYMAVDGHAIFFVEFPGDERGFDFADELGKFATLRGCSVSLSLDRPLQVTEQARISANTAWYLNRHLSIGELAEKFLCYYQHLGYSLLHPVFCVIHNDGQGRIVYQDKI